MNLALQFNKIKKKDTQSQLKLFPTLSIVVFLMANFTNAVSQTWDQPVSCAGSDSGTSTLLSKARFCDSSIGNYFVSGGKDQTVSTYLTALAGQTEKYYDSNKNEVRMLYNEYKFFEGSISLTQIGVAFKTISDNTAAAHPLDQICIAGTGTSCTTKSTRSLAIWKFWQLPHSWLGSTALNYDDLRTGKLDPVINNFYEVLYAPYNEMLTSTYSDIANAASYGWFVGDVVPLKSCAYIVQMNTKSFCGTKYYGFQRIMMSIQYDTTNFNKIVKIVPDKYFIASSTSNSVGATLNDIPANLETINFYWRWNAFYWFYKGQLIVKQDSKFATTSDPCQRSTPIFNPTSTSPSSDLKHYAIQIGTSTDSIVSHAFVYEGLYMVWASNKQQIYRLEGTPATTSWGTSAASGLTASFFTISMIKNSASIISTDTIIQITSMEYYGLFVNILGKNTFIEIEPDKIMSKDATTGLLVYSNAVTQEFHTYIDTLRYDDTAMTDSTKTLGIRLRTDVVTACPNTQFKFVQTQGSMDMHRPVYLICEGTATQTQPSQQYTIWRVTTVLNKFMSIPTTHPTYMWTSLYTYPLQTLRFHIFSVQPGLVDTTSTGYSPSNPKLTDKVTSGNFKTFSNVEAVVVDLRQQNEVLRWPLGICGDGVVNATYAFEQCDYNKFSATPYLGTPIDITGYDATKTYGLSTLNTYNYPRMDTDNGAYNCRDTALTYTPSCTKYWSGEITYWWDLPTKSYYQCNTLCKKFAVNLCGDGIPSNGRVPDSSHAGGYLLAPTNQQVGTDLVQGVDATYEACDDGNNNSGDGCKGDCTAIETGYECPRWGIPCLLKCGNGHRQWYKDSNGVIQDEKYQRKSLLLNNIGNLVVDSSGNTYVAEQCDLGTLNVNDPTSSTYKDSACNADCMITNTNLWSCSWVADYDTVTTTLILGYHSKCTYLCGNQQVDSRAGSTSPVVAAQPLMIVDETCDTGQQQWQGQEWAPGYTYPLTTGATSSNSFAGVKLTTLLGTIIQGDGKTNPTKGYIYWRDPLAAQTYAGITPSPVPRWYSNEKDNTNWLVGCDKYCQIISTTNPSSQYFTGTDSTGATVAPTTGVSYTTATPRTIASLPVGFTNFKCPNSYTGSIACTDRCGDGIFDGLLTFYDGPYKRLTKVFPVGVSGYTPLNQAIGVGGGTFDYSTRMPPETCDTGSYYSSTVASYTSQIGYNYDGIGDPSGTHGCDSMCQVVNGWTCTVFFYKMLTRTSGYVEEPLFRSECYYTTDDPTLKGTPSKGPYRRRLTPQDFDSKGRYLHHTPLRYNNYLLPSNTNEFVEDTLKLSPKTGLNGQVRIIEAPCQISSYSCSTTDVAVGVIYGYQNAAYTSSDFVYFTTRGKATPANDISQTITMSNNGNAQRGKMRNTFGQYLVMNTNLNQIEIWGYKNLGSGSIQFTNFWTSAVETSVQYLGAHEFYWWPYNSFLMARLSDGSSFKFFRFDNNFQTNSQAAESTLASASKLQDIGYNLFNVNGRVTVPPVFYEQFIFLYTSQSSTASGTLSAYYYNSAKMGLDLICTETFTETSQLYQNYSLIKVGADGFIFHMAGAATTQLYYCNPNSDVTLWPSVFTKLTVAGVKFDWTGCSATPTNPNPSTIVKPTTAPIYCPSSPSTLESGVILKQARDDPQNYKSGVIPPIWGWINNAYFMQFAYSNNNLSTSPGSGTAATLKPTQSILLPKELNLLNVSSTAQGNFVPENMDIGNLFLAVLSPVQCKATYASSAVTSPSVYYYNLSNTAITYDLINCDTTPSYSGVPLGYFNTPDGLEDYSGCTAVMDTSVTPNKQKVTTAGYLQFTGVAYDPFSGWTCVNLPPTETGTQAWQSLV